MTHVFVLLRAGLLVSLSTRTMTSAQAGQVPVTTYGQQSGERRLDHPAGRLIGAQPFERSVAQTFPRALTILHLHDDHRPDPLRRQIGSQFPEVIAEHGGGAQGQVFRFRVCSCTSSMPRASSDRPDPTSPHTRSCHVRRTAPGSGCRDGRARARYPITTNSSVCRTGTLIQSGLR